MQVFVVVSFQKNPNLESTISLHLKTVQPTQSNHAQHCDPKTKALLIFHHLPMEFVDVSLPC